jgi:hypothetical protein
VKAHNRRGPAATAKRVLATESPAPYFIGGNIQNLPGETIIQLPQSHFFVNI